MKHLTRRGTLRALLGTSAAGALAACSDPVSKPLTNPEATPDRYFAHGIASGDPAANSIILWTRITPEVGQTGPVPVKWEMSETDDFARLVSAGTFSTGPSRDWTVKAEAKNLNPGTSYFYRFRFAEHYSVTGRTRTLPDGPLEQARFAIVSCASWPHGFYNGYDHIAREPGFDAVIHLGDYIYEYGADGYGSKFSAQTGRVHEPPREIISLDDYRTRHAQYKSDRALQAAHAAHPFILLWDDHEVANNSWEKGAENHNPGEGSWEDRRKAAMQAYYEWLPVREPVEGRPRHHLFRAYEYGDLLTLATIETRLTARAEQVEPDAALPANATPEQATDYKENVLGAEGRHMIGDEQLAFLKDTFGASTKAGKPWRLLANQILMGKVNTPDLTPHVSEEVIATIEKDWPGVRGWVTNSPYELPLYADTWSGYPWARERLYQTLKTAGATDMIVLTGDAHEFWANDLYAEDGTKMGIELGTSSITSQTVEEYLGPAAADLSLLVTRENPEVRYYDPMAKGYIDLTVTRAQADAVMVGLSTVLSRDYTTSPRARFRFKKAGDSVKFDGARHLGAKQRLLYWS